MIIITIPRKHGKPSRLVTWLIGKLIPGLSFWIVDPYTMTSTMRLPEVIRAMDQIVEPSNLRTTYELNIVVNPPKEGS